MGQFRKRPVVIEAIQLRDGTREELLAAFVPNYEWPLVISVSDEGHVEYATVDTLEGRMVANLGDWIIKGVKGELYPCKPDIFAATYEEVQEIVGTEQSFSFAPEVEELIQGAIEATDGTPGTARLRKALEAFGVR